MSELTRRIEIGRQFSRYPAGRYVADGPFSGEAFRERLLVPALRSGARVIVEMDGTVGYGSSFLEEAFGGLVRQGFQASELLQRIELRCDSDPSIVGEVEEYIRTAGERR